MLVKEKIKHGIHFYTVWFAKEAFKNPGVIQYHQAEFPIDKGIPFDSLISDLSLSADEIKGKFAKNCRYEVNRAERENIQAEFYLGGEISDELIEEFIDFFKEFWISKGVEFNQAESLLSEMREYRDMGALHIAIARINGKKMVYHTHLLDDERGRLWHSASLFREIEGEGNLRALMGMANRYLHYMEMLHLKEIGKRIFDWGGAGHGEMVESITKFKESFGGDRVIQYDRETANGLTAKIFFLLKSFL